MTATGFLHPGAMGASVAAACSGDRLWASEGRSSATRERADAVGLIDVGTVRSLAERCEVIVSVCPPDRALEVADAVAATGFSGVYVDANAISPATAAAVADRFDSYVDGGIIGPPAHVAGTTRLYLSGDRAADVATRWDGSALDVRTVVGGVDGGVGAASALKMVFAGWTKGTSALLLAIDAAAEHHGVAAALREEWSISMPDLVERSERTAAATGPKAWRFEGEMHEIADTLAAAGLPPGFHRAAAEVYRRMAAFASVDAAPSLDDVVAALLDADDADVTGAPAPRPPRS